MSKGKAPERKRIKGFGYEIDESGAVFSLSDQPGFGVGRQIKPVKVKTARWPTYTLHRGGMAKNWAINDLYSSYFCEGPQFNTQWCATIRDQADEHNAQLRDNFLKAKAEGNSTSTVVPAHAPPAPLPKAKPEQSKAPSEGWLKFWMDGEIEYRRRTWTTYTQQTGLNAFDPQVCPLG